MSSRELKGSSVGAGRAGARKADSGGVAGETVRPDVAPGPSGRTGRPARRPRPDPVSGDRFLADEDGLLAIEGAHEGGLTAAQIVEVFTARGVHLSEAPHPVTAWDRRSGEPIIVVSERLPR